MAAGDEPPGAVATRARVRVVSAVVHVQDEFDQVVVAAVVVGEHHVPSLTNSADVAANQERECRAIAGKGRYTGRIGSVDPVGSASSSPTYRAHTRTTADSRRRQHRSAD